MAPRRTLRWMENDPSQRTEAVYVVAAIERVESAIASLAARVEQHLTHKRKTPSKRVREMHIAFARTLPGCPFCDEPIFDGDGQYVGVIHHIERASDATASAVMACCKRCNMKWNQEPAPRAVVDAYAYKRKRYIAQQHAQLPGPLFAVRKAR